VQAGYLDPGSKRQHVESTLEFVEVEYTSGTGRASKRLKARHHPQSTASASTDNSACASAPQIQGTVQTASASSFSQPNSSVPDILTILRQLNGVASNAKKEDNPAEQEKRDGAQESTAISQNDAGSELESLKSSLHASHEREGRLYAEKMSLYDRLNVCEAQAIAAHKENIQLRQRIQNLERVTLDEVKRREKADEELARWKEKAEALKEQLRGVFNVLE
jgi:chromosome segregation ATPase